MNTYYRIETGPKGLNEALAGFFRGLLERRVVEALFVSARLPYRKHERIVKQNLIEKPEHLSDIDPFAPVIPVSSARLLSSLTVEPGGKKVAAVLRPCEARAFTELVKLNQAKRDNLLLIGMDCYGRYENRDYLRFADNDDRSTELFLKAIQDGKGTAQTDDFDIAEACKSCEHPADGLVDLRLCVIGEDFTKVVHVQAVTEEGRLALETMELTAVPEPKKRKDALEKLIADRTAHRDAMLVRTRERAKGMPGLVEVLADCVNCYNCRVACPVCYCKECVFVTDTFRHPSEKYFGWAEKFGRLKMPTDTVFFHLTRMLHISSLCVGCGQCSSACPNGIPVMELFRAAADRTQSRFEYLPGRSWEEAQPLATFHEDEFNEVTGQTK